MSEAEIMDTLRRIEAKVDALARFSGWQTDNGMPMTVAEKAEMDRLARERSAPVTREGITVTASVE